MDPEPKTITTEKARAGTTLHRIRYVLLASLALAVIAMIVLFEAAPATNDGTAPPPGVTQT